MRRRRAAVPLREARSGGRTRRRGRLARTADTYEFLVRPPFGASVISGYRKAARHFGLQTMEDPTMEGSDGYRVLVHKSAPVLRRAADVLDRAYGSDRQSAIDEAEMWLATSDVTWFAQDWRYWDEAQDEGALACLGWKRLVVKSEKSYRITLKLIKKRRSR
jgi:hypothetical protein